MERPIVPRGTIGKRQELRRFYGVLDGEEHGRACLFYGGDTLFDGEICPAGGRRLHLAPASRRC